MANDDISAALGGVVIRPGDPDWDAARRFHSGIGEPALVIRAASVDDVRSVVRYAAAEGLEVLVRSGGHSAWGSVPGGLTLDLAALADVAVEGTRVSIGGGAHWGAVAAVLASHGLGISSGDTTSVGVGGLTLGGGIGLMVRAWGLACDQLVGVQLVTAEGDVVEATDATHPELMWALRGGGGNFGVVTRFDFEAHPLRAVFAAELGFEGDARQVLRALRDVMTDAPRELTVTYMDVPPMDPSAPPGSSIGAVWAGDDETRAREALAPLLAVPGVVQRDLGVRPYPEVLLEQPEFDPETPMPGFVGGNTLLRVLDDAAIERLVAFRESNPASVLFLRSLGGAYGDVPQEESAFPARDATWFAMAGAFDVPGMLDDAARTRALGDWNEIESLGGGVYGNFTTSTEPGWAERMYPPATMARLAAVKREWDPKNVFRRNHNVLPA
ncbi:FAD-binding oxidoreductase [Microbacterium paludicola]|uniref:FAD-binding oxidoreductase n=1 Tax=Microbacterium paludicola TaxID=300019 RepID=A0A4Y9FYA8_9MICO|nr:FAD-binding oxidoreductase [Microbacterium paludicola]MBF0815796.1 FAD-binding oxidoreductase [Microbacterium paludicola]TFU33625.1 FAD-binding oxidoreductase [Microbacterium paludicola]